MNPFDIINEFYDPGSRSHQILVKHGQQVAKKAVEIATRVPHLNPDLNFIKEAALLHDIAMFKTNSFELGCSGNFPYVCHGYLGRELLEKKGFPAHALVCERHVGTGITIEDIERHHLPLPRRDMVPTSIEEQIICFADKFFSKNGHMTDKEKRLEDILNSLRRYGPDKVACFQSWMRLFGENQSS